MRILITGGEGQLGRALARAFAGHDVQAPGRGALDIRDPIAVRTALDSMGPDAVINAAALTDTALCETEPDLARAVNADAPGLLAEAAASRATFLHVSTNEVFAGVAIEPYREDAVVGPLNVYAASKAEGERRVLAANAAALVVRTSWLYGEGGNNFPSKVLAAARAGRPLRFVTDEIATPTFVDDLAGGIRRLIERTAAGAPGSGGVYHLTNDGEASRYDWAREILALAGAGDEGVEPITTDQLYAGGYNGPRKPRYSVLANTRARALGIALRDWREALADYFARYRVAVDV